MAEELWLLRHGDAQDGGGMPDEARKLTEKGEEQARAAGCALAALGIEFAHVFTSPRVRARDTARLACEALGANPIVHQPLNGGFDYEDALELALTARPDGRVLAVGHEPDFSQVVHDLTGARIDMRKGGVAVIALEGARHGRLVLLLRPAELRRIG
jgi:phosphohistidine phosphatase